MKIRVIKGQDLGRLYDISRSAAMGSAPDNDIIIDEPGVSRNHAKFSVNEYGVCVIEDLNSTNGVRVNGEKIDIRHPLRPGDRIGAGEAVLLVTDNKGNVPSGTEEDSENLRRRRKELIVGAAVSLVLLAAVLFFAFAIFSPEETDVVKEEPEPETVAEVEDELEEPDDDIHEEEPDDVWLVEEGEEVVPDREDPAPEVDEDEELPAEEDLPEEVEERLHNVVVRSDPPGAEVRFNDQNQGETPLELWGLPSGRHRVELTKQGYEPLSRLFYVPVDEPLNPYDLRLKPRTLRVVSEPEGATVVHGSRMLGKTPLVIEELPPGEHTLRLISPGYQRQEIEAEVSSLEGETIEVVMERVTGGIDLVSLPSGADVYVNEAHVGKTSAPEEESRVDRSLPLRIQGFMPGRRRVRLEHSHAPESRTRMVRVREGEQTEAEMEVWAVTRRLALIDGQVLQGMIVEEKDNGELVVAVSPDERVTLAPFRIIRDEELSAEQAQSYLADEWGRDDDLPGRQPSPVRPETEETEE